MFKRAVITDEISQDFARAVEVAREYGLEGVELRSAWEKNPHELTEKEILRLRELVAQAGMAVPCVSGPIFKCRLRDRREYEEHVAILKRCLEVAEVLGARMVRAFTFWDEGDFERDLPLIVEKLAAVDSLLAKAGSIMVVESDPATSANSHERLAKVMAKVGSEHIKALWDPGNNLYVVAAGRPFPEGYELLRPYLAHVHVKDVRRGPGPPEACRLGQGDVGYPQVFRRLVADGYNGWVSLETHYRKRGPLEEDLLALPKGSAFSLGGEEAFRESLASWNEMLSFEGLGR